MTTESQERSPYVGPRPFERQDRDRFFGRERETSEILSLVTAHRVLLLYAQSGAGKTSLLNAGLVPLLEEKGFEVLPLARVQGLIPKDIEPEEILNLYVFKSLMSWAEEEADTKRLAQMSLASFLKEREHPLDEEGLPSPRVVIFDQFEELFTFYSERWRDREEFFKQVADALEANPLLRVVLVVREEYIAQIDPYAPLLPEKLRTRFRLERLRKEAVLAAIKGPLGDTSRSFAEGVAEELVEDLMKVQVVTALGTTEKVTGEFVESVQLQVVCQSLWRNLPPDVTVITQDRLQTPDDVNQALSRFYETCVERAARETGVEVGDLLSWFEHTLITPAGTRGTVYRGREETGGIPNAAVVVLEGLHLIREERRAGARWYELTHDRFIEPILAYKKANLRGYLRLLNQRGAEDVCQSIKRANQSLIWWGSSFLWLTVIGAILRVVWPDRFDWKLPLVTGGLSLLQLGSAFLWRPMADLQKHLTQQQAEDTYQSIKRANQFLIWWGIVFLSLTVTGAILSAVWPDRFDWKLPLVTGGLSLLQLGSAFLGRPMADLQKHPTQQQRAEDAYRTIKQGNQVLIWLCIVFLSLTVIGAILSTVWPDRFDWKLPLVTGGLSLLQLGLAFLWRPMADLQKYLTQQQAVEALVKQIEAIEQIEKGDYQALKDLGFGAGEVSQRVSGTEAGVAGREVS